MAELYVNNNGTLLPTNQPTIQTGSRSFLYGDGLFETVRIINGYPINLESHFNRLVEGAKAIRLRIPVYLTVTFLETKIKELIRKNEITNGGKCRISLDRINGGSYLPEANEVNYFIEVLPYPANYFELNAKGLEVDIYQGLKKQNNFLANFKTKNGLISVMTAILAQEKGFDDFFIMNESNAVLESSNSNIFLTSNGVLYTPGLNEGCVGGTMRMQIINLAIQNNIRVYECSITSQNLLIADEVFLTNAIRGITWVGGYRTKRYENVHAKKLLSLLNNYWKNTLLNTH